MLSSQQLGERIGLFRKRSSLTQAQLAERIGVSRTTVVAMEKGERRPAELEILRVATALGVAVHDLLRESLVASTVSRRFRTGGRRVDDPSAVERLVQTLQQFGSWYAELERLHGLTPAAAPLQSLITFRAAESSHTDADVLGRQAAATVRSLVALGDEPVYQLRELLEVQAGLRIFVLDMPAVLSGLLIWSDDIGACVALNRRHPEERRRWSLAHELGHYLRDREAGDVLDREEGFRSSDPSEVFAQWFAAAFLMPASGVARQFSDRCRVGGGRFTSFALLEMARFYGVSFEAMARRLEEERLLPVGTLERLVDSRIRPKDLDAAAPTARESAIQPFPRRYLDLALAAFDQELISEGRLCELLATDRTAVRRLLLEFLERRRAPYGEDQEFEAAFSGEDLRTR
jgi:Zn-dependent peptidase ImmA (M78 family)/transcriptional regulator with XRE-family HTH domain